VVPSDQTDLAVEVLDSHHPGSTVIGRATEEVGVVRLPGLPGTSAGFSST
jgi:hypothetical protein